MDLGPRWRKTILTRSGLFLGNVIIRVSQLDTSIGAL